MGHWFGYFSLKMPHTCLRNDLKVNELILVRAFMEKWEFLDKRWRQTICW